MSRSADPLWKISLALLVVVSTSALGIRFMFHDGNGQSDIRLGINHWPGYEYLFIAKEQGFFEDVGLNVELVELGSLFDIKRAYLDRRINAMATTAIEVVGADIPGGEHPRIVLVSDVSDGADVILSMPGIRTASDLRGKRVGVEAGSLGEYLVTRYLEIEGVDLGEVSLVNVVQGEVADFLDSKRIDAVMSYPPLSSQLISKYEMNTLFSSADIPGEIVDVISVNASLLRRRPEIASKIARVWQLCIDYVQAHTEQAVAFLARNSNVEINEYEKALVGVQFFGLDDQSEFFEANGKLERVIRQLITSQAGELSAETQFIDPRKFIFP